MWQTIAASETDANSPLNQTLMDKVRGNLDHLYSIGASMKFVNARFSNSATPADFVLDNSQDWRDRFIQALGMVFQGTNNDCNTVELGGSNGDRIGNQYAPAPSALRVALFDHWFYSAGGASGRADDPRLTAEDALGDPDIYIWVSSSTGYLMLSAVTSRDSSYRNLVVHLRLTWSEDQGAH